MVVGHILPVILRVVIDVEICGVLIVGLLQLLDRHALSSLLWMDVSVTSALFPHRQAGTCGVLRLPNVAAGPVPHLCLSFYPFYPLADDFDPDSEGANTRRGTGLEIIVQRAPALVGDTDRLRLRKAPFAQAERLGDAGRHAEGDPCIPASRRERLDQVRAQVFVRQHKDSDIVTLLFLRHDEMPSNANGQRAISAQGHELLSVLTREITECSLWMTMSVSPRFSFRSWVECKHLIDIVQSLYLHDPLRRSDSFPATVRPTAGTALDV